MYWRNWNFSFNGNKIITTGGGGALLTNNDEFAYLARHLSTTAKLNHPYEFFHDQIGWNDRLPNKCCIRFLSIRNVRKKINKKKVK